jgi:hypothetical protein
VACSEQGTRRKDRAASVRRFANHPYIAFTINALWARRSGLPAFWFRRRGGALRAPRICRADDSDRGILDAATVREIFPILPKRMPELGFAARTDRLSPHHSQRKNWASGEEAADHLGDAADEGPEPLPGPILARLRQSLEHGSQAAQRVPHTLPTRCASARTRPRPMPSSKRPPTIEELRPEGAA